MTTDGGVGRPHLQERLPLLVAAILAALAAVSLLTGPVANAADGIREGFPGYYTAARLVVEGRWSPAVYDDATFAAEVLRRTDGREGEIFRPNPPTAALIVLPVAGPDIDGARVAWLGIEVALVLLAWRLLVLALPSLGAPAVAVGLLALILAWEPLQLDLEMGQVYTPLLALHAAALAGLGAVAAAARRGTPGTTVALLAGAAIGAAAALKLAGLPWLAALAVRLQLRVVAGALAATAVLVIVTLPFAGAAGWSAFGATAWADLTRDRPHLAVAAFQSTAGLLRHLLDRDPTWNPGAGFDQPFLARSLGLVIAAWVVGFSLLLARRGRWDLVAGVSVTAGVLALTVAQEYAHALLIVPAAIGIARVVEAPGSRVRLLWLAASIALLAGPWPYRHPALDAGWAALLAYPRVYGAWLLWAWLSRELVVEARARTTPGDPGAAAREPGYLAAPVTR